MTIRPGTCAVLIAVVLAANGLSSACSKPRSELAPTTTVTNPTAPTQPTTVGEPTCPPTLRVLAPADGSRVKAPFSLSYETRCFPIGRDGTIYLATDGMRIDLHPPAATGAVTVPDHPLLSGRRALTIQLAQTNGQTLANPEATVVMTVTIEGSR